MSLNPDTTSLRFLTIIIALSLCQVAVNLLPSASRAQEKPTYLSEDASWLWPTNASRYMSSSFGETRAAHFHAAMDIGTWGHEGYAVFASRDGIVHRVAIGPVGYGNVIYLRHDDGIISLYAHLLDFHPRIRSVVDSLRLQDYSFEFDRNMEDFEIRFRRGQQIGWTGSTGVGPPHLHFELRTPEGRPFNPKLAGVYIEDTIPPQFSGLAVEPLSYNSTVNGSPRIYRSRPARRGGRNDFGTLDASGEVGLAVNVSDRANASNNVHAVYELKMYVDDELYFHSRADSFSYGQSRQMFLDRVFPILRDERRGYQRLYVRNANTLPFYQHTGHTGRLDLPPGEYAVRIVASDFYGNSTSAYLQLNVTEPEETQITSRLHFPRGYADWRIQNGTVRAGEHEGAKSTGGTGFSGTSDFTAGSGDVPTGESPGDLAPEYSGDETPGSAPPPPPPPSEPIFPVNEPPTTLIWHKNWVRPGSGTAEATGSPEIAIRPLGSFRDEMRIYSSASDGLPLDIADRLELRKGNRAWVLHRVRPEHPVTIYHDGMRISVNFPLDAFFEPVSMGIAGTYLDFTLFPDIEPFRRPATVRILLDEDLRNREGIGLYRVNSRNGRLSHVSSRTNKDGSMITGTIRSGGSYTIAYDTLAPEISRPHIGKWSHVNRYYATVSVDDDLSGIDYRSAIVHVNGQRGIAEYDPEKKLLVFHHPDFRPQRTNEISVTLSDRAGNTAHRTFTGVRYN